MTKEQLWQAVLGELELSLSKAHFTTWLKNTFISLLEDDQVVVGVPNAFTQAWLEKKYHKAILRVLQGITNGQIKKVIYKVESQLSIKKEDPLKDLTSNISTFQKLNKIKKDKFEKSVTQRFGLNPKYTFKNFVVGKGNELAHAACCRVANNPGVRYNPLFLYGGVGLGKTHLIQAIGHKVIAKFGTNKKILYINAERFTNEYIQAIRTGKTKDFKNTYRAVDILLVDDIQFIAGKEGTQEEFFHTFNDLHQKNSQIVLTSDRPPKAIPALEERLTSRFEWGMIVDVSSPDLETRIAILESKIKEKNYYLDKEIIQYIAANIQKNVRELEGALNKIIAYHELYNINPTLETTKNILSSLISSYRKPTNISSRQLLNTVADFYEIKVDDLTGSSRKKELVIPRQISMYLLRTELDYSYPTIGKELGGRDHTTAMHAYKKINKEIKNEGRIKQEVDLIQQRLYN